MHLWGIDFGGTKIECVVLQSRRHPEVMIRRRIATEAAAGYAHMLNQVKRLVDDVSAEVGFKPTSIGLGHPGALDPMTGLIKNANTVALIGKPFDKDLERLVGVPFKFANDANCFAVAEALMGAVPDVLPEAPVVFGVIMGTGVGGGIVVHGRAIAGRQGIAGEWGHNFLDEAGGPCYCGRVGCVERILAGPALERYYEAHTGTHLSLKEIVALDGKDPHATATINRLIQYFGKAMAVVVNILDPDAIVLGGGVGNIDRLYQDGVAEVRNHVFNTRLDTLFLRPKLGDSAGVFGAALL